MREYVSKCSVCQASKSFNKAPQGLHQPLPLRGKIWDSISIDFITHLQPSSGKTTALVVIDRLSKQSHFSALGPYVTAPKIAEVFIQDVIRLHGIPTSIISD